MSDLDEYEAAIAAAMKAQKVWGRAVVAQRVARSEMEQAEAHKERCRQRMSDSLGKPDESAA